MRLGEDLKLEMIRRHLSILTLSVLCYYDFVLFIGVGEILDDKLEELSRPCSSSENKVVSSVDSKESGFCGGRFWTCYEVQDVRFQGSDRVSVGLAGRVLKKLVRRRLLYHSYSMQVHGYVSSHTSSGRGSFTLVHGYHGSFSLRHWLQQADWLPTLEATLVLDEESGSSNWSELFTQSRTAHTELRLENVHISPVDRHIKVGILGNAADFYEDGPSNNSVDNNIVRRQMMIAFDMRCVGFMMAKMVLRELMDPLIFMKFKTFFTKGNDPTCLREFLLQVLSRNSPSGNAGFQELGSRLESSLFMLATKPSKRISCLDALRHPFLCGPRWRVVQSMDIIRWGLGSTAVRITEEYIYGLPQRDRLAHFIELLEMLNPHSKPKNWLEFLPGKWRLLYSTGRHIGLTLRQPPARILVGDVHLTISRPTKLNTNLSLISDIGFTVMMGQDWPHDKTGITGSLQVNSSFRLKAGRRLYLKEENTTEKLSLPQSNVRDILAQKLSGRNWRKAVPPLRRSHQAFLWPSLFPTTLMSR
ncbi:hypothetical protein LWI29_022068 [Acer saccharum]|uniref:Plastid lipid-associated protein/fibrillin conserved domain-containing protein n=1 Tax=Acer saccharum TaxID=4024 RepID=A0AA39VYL6_ACESA|nr:hypothetical protein LWI29_022068 [Acer saccharum]